MQTAKLQNQKGFTLVEIAIVLVIIGLLLGGVLKGQEMINSAKIKTDTDSLKSIQASAYAFRDRAGYYPGTARSADPSDSSLDGVQIAPVTSDTNPALANTFFSDLNSEGFLKSASFNTEVDDDGDFTAGYAEDGTTSAATGAIAVGVEAAAAAGVLANKNYICIAYSTAVDNAEAIVTGIDIKLDDGNPDTGIVRYSAPGTGGGTACLEI